MAFVPGVPDCHVLVTVGPGHLEHTETALFKDLHPVAFDLHLAVAGFGPGFEQLFSIFFPHDHEIQGLASPEIRYGHSMQSHAVGILAWGFLFVFVFPLAEQIPEVFI